MKELDLCVVLIRDEYESKLLDAEVFGFKKKPYSKGEIAFYNGEPYISSIDNNTVYPLDNSWKKVIIEN